MIRLTEWLSLIADNTMVRFGWKSLLASSTHMSSLVIFWYRFKISVVLTISAWRT